jgi:mannose-6-phosphate isomerase-like protein (cupin superfamily)
MRKSGGWPTYRVFQPRGYFEVPDGTEVSPFLNATDIYQDDVPWDALGDLSIAAGRIRPRMHSSVHMHPIVTQVTYVVSGSMTVRMKDARAEEAYELSVQPGSAVITQPRTLFQLLNDTDAVADVLYIVSPSYVFEMEGGEVKYDDALIVAATWEELVAANYDVPTLTIRPDEVRTRRAESLARLARRKAVGGASQ